MGTNIVESDLMGTAAVSRVLGVGVARVIQLANEGKLWHFRLPGGQRIFRKDDVARLKIEREGTKTNVDRPR